MNTTNAIGLTLTLDVFKFVLYRGLIESILGLTLTLDVFKLL